jgi:hypothetical protein
VANCHFDKHYRQGLSIITANGLTVERTTFSNTNGTAPECGIDIEPDYASEEATDVVLKDLQLINNMGGGLFMNLGNFNASTADLSIVAQRITVDGRNTSDGVGIAVGNIVDVGGNVSISDSTVRNMKGCGLLIYKKAAGAATVSIDNTEFVHVASGATLDGHSCAPQGGCAAIMVMGGWDPPYTTDMGEFELTNCTIVDGLTERTSRPPIRAGC